MGQDIKCDLAIVGGGLSGGLIAYALAKTRPEVKVCLIESSPRLGGNHVWSFFSNDVAAEDRWLVEPFVSRSWNGYTVRFPGHERMLGLQYNAIRSDRFDSVLREALSPESIVTGKAVQVRNNGVALETHQVIRADGVIDARGPGDLTKLDLGWQKFVGQELLLKAPHGLEYPVVMDATVDQIDGYRFLYCLPFAPDRLLVEDTYYSDSMLLDRATVVKRIAEYAEQKGWKIAAVTREESGVLPVVMGGDFEAYRRSTGPGLIKVGMRGGLFHPTTGFTLPDAVRTAAFIAASEDVSGSALRHTVRDRARELWGERSFYRVLDTMLFRAAEGPDRYKIFERFYKLNPNLIARFYAAQSTGADKLRILSGKPPVPIGKAIRAVREALS